MDEQKGKEASQLQIAIDRCNSVYEKAIADRDIKTALASLKELHKIQGLHSRTEPVPESKCDECEALRQLELIESYILPLKLIDDNYPLEEHCRVAADCARRYINQPRRCDTMTEKKQQQEPQEKGLVCFNCGCRDFRTIDTRRVNGAVRRKRRCRYCGRLKITREK